jgi:hypothetical protein
LTGQRGSKPAEKTVYGHLLKFLPFGFWLVHNQPMEFVIDALDITPRGVPDTTREVVSFNLRHAPHHLYPENPSGHHIMLFANEQSSVAAPAIASTTSDRRY